MAKHVAERVRFSTFAALAGLCLSPQFASAAGDIDPAIVAAQTGHYLVAPVDGKDGCRISLTPDETIGGYAVTGSESCATTLPSIAEVAAWNFGENGSVLLIDVLRKVRARFEESEGAPLLTDGKDGPKLALVPAADGISHLPAPANMKGAWQMKRPGGTTVCHVTFADGADSNGNFALTVADPCDTAVTTLRLQSWQASGLGITLLGDGGSSLAFTATASGFEKNRSEGGKPLLLVRH